MAKIKQSLRRTSLMCAVAAAGLVALVLDADRRDAATAPVTAPAIAETTETAQLDVKAGTSHPTSNEPYRTIGRFRDRGGALSFAWPGSAIEFDMTGGELAATFEDGGLTWLDVDIDGTTTPLQLKSGIHTYTLLDAAPGLRRVRIARRTETLSGRTSLLSIESDGETYATPAADRRLLVIGDSISAGYGVEGENQHCRFSFDTQNQTKTYAALAAQDLNADLHAIAISGRGLVRNYANNSAPTMKKSYQLVFPDGPKWSEDFSPHAIVVHLGTNDFAQNDPTDKFVDAYVELLGALNAAHPNAKLYGAMGPMLDEPDRTRAVDAVQAALTAYNVGADKTADFIQFSWASSGRARGCDWHPGADTHKEMAQTLLQKLESDLNWSTEIDLTD